MKRGAERLGKASAVQVALLAVLCAGLVFLGWTWLVSDRPVVEVPETPRADVAVPSLRFFTREDGMPVAEVDHEVLSRFLVAFGIPPFGMPPPPIEAAVARSLHAALQSLAQDRSAKSYGGLGQIFDALRMLDQCGTCFAAAVREAPDEHRWRHQLGRHLATQGDLAGAEEHFRRAIEIQPAYLPTHWRLARLCADQGRTDEAEAILRKTLADSSVPYPWTELASLAIQGGRPGEAKSRLEEALRRDGLDGRAHALMSQTLVALGDPERAEAHARKGRYSVKSLDPIPDPIVREGLEATGSVAYRRVAARSASGLAPGERVVLWEGICSADPANADDKIQLSNAYFDAGRPNDAIATLEAAIAQEPRGARFRLARAQLAMRMQDHAAALRFAEESIALEHAPVAALGVKSFALLSMGRTAEALAPAERALELSPDEPEIYQFLGSIYANLGRIDDALATYRRGLALDPESASLRQSLAQLEQRPPNR